MERGFRPTRFESLSQASSARAAMIEAARAAFAGDVSVLGEVSRPRQRSLRTPVALSAFGAFGIAAALACGGGAKGTNHEFTPTPENPSPTATRMEPTATFEATATLPPEATATPEAKVLSFGEISQMVAEAYNTTQIPTGLCNLEQLNFMMTNSKAAREAYDQNPVDFNQYATAYGRVVGEVQKIADSTGSQTFVNLQKTLEDSFITDARNIFSRLGAGEEDMQQFFSIWRSNWLDRGSQNYDASRCGIVLPKN